jgi:hypothetical protein
VFEPDPFSASDITLEVHSVRAELKNEARDTTFQAKDCASVSAVGYVRLFAIVQSWF